MRASRWIDLSVTIPTSPQAGSKRVFFYTQALPAPTGSGAAIRVWTNLRAYLDLGYQPHVLFFRPDVESLSAVPGLPVDVEVEETRPSAPRLYYKIAFLLRRPLSWELDYSYPYRRIVREAVVANEAAHPGSIHHFEYLDIAVAAVPRLRATTVFSCHDMESQRTDLIQRMRRRIGQGRNGGWRRTLRRRSVQRAEKLAVAHAHLVLSIAAHECDFMKEQWSAQNVALFPMSCPNEEIPHRSRDWCEGGILRLLHIGSLDAYVGFHSLEFLLKEIFPRLPDQLLRSIELEIVGTESSAETSQQIRRMASAFSNVRFHGFQESLDSYYSSADLQVVAIPEATGLRTRIVESFARGVPVLSSRDSADGLHGLTDGENIFCAGEPQEYVEVMKQIMKSPTMLTEVARKGRETYDAHYSRKVAASTLCDLLVEFSSGARPAHEVMSQGSR